MKNIVKPLYDKIKRVVPVHYDTIAKILRGDRHPSPELAKKLEQATGVHRLCWLYPDEYPNPYIKPNNRNKTKQGQNKEDKPYNIPPITTWQFFYACRKILGDSFLQKVYKKSIKQIYRWSANPDFCEDVEKNPLDRLVVLIRKLAEVGRKEIALAAVRILADVLDCDVFPKKDFTSDKPAKTERDSHGSNKQRSMA